MELVLDLWPDPNRGKMRVLGMLFVVVGLMSGCAMQEIDEQEGVGTDSQAIESLYWTPNRFRNAWGDRCHSYQPEGDCELADCVGPDGGKYTMELCGNAAHL